MDAFFQSVCEFFQTDGAGIVTVFSAVWRYAAPLLAILIIWRAAAPLLKFRREPEIWAYLAMPDGQQFPVTHWENILGRGKGCDLVINHPDLARNHAVLTRYDDGSWSITDIGARGEVWVNGKQVEACALEYGDVISLSGVEMKLVPITAQEVEEQNYYRTRPSDQSLPGLTLFLLSLFQIFTAVQFWMNSDAEYARTIVMGFVLLCAVQWVFFVTLKILRRSGFEVETLAFFLSTLGLAVIASSSPKEITRQLVCIVGGIAIYLIIAWSLRDLNRAKKFRYVAAVGGFALLAVTLVFGTEVYGARGWIYIGSLSVQPAELVKLCFVYVGASTMDRIVTKRNLITFIIYSAVICGCLAFMNDFGAALIFFVTFLVIAFLRSGSFATVALACSATGIAGLMAIRLRPHILKRFSNWGHVWEDTQGGGFDQSRAMMCVACGGLFGVGAGKGIFKLQHILAADTDYVFAFLCEEWGLIIGVLAVAAIIVLGLFVLRSSAVGRSSFYTIGACAAVAILMTQTILNVFGTMDLLPLTGVTFPFLSNGGSSMLCSWGLLAFIKAADTRQNASLAVQSLKAEEVEPLE